VMLRFADRTSRHLDYSIDISAALDKLAGARQQQQQHSSWMASASCNYDEGVTAAKGSVDGADGSEMPHDHQVITPQQLDLSTPYLPATGTGMTDKPRQQLFGSDNRLGVPGGWMSSPG